MPTVSVIKPKATEPEPPMYFEIGCGLYAGRTVQVVEPIGRDFCVVSDLAEPTAVWVYDNPRKAAAALDLKPLPPGTEIKITV